MFCNGSIFHQWPKWEIFEEGTMASRNTRGGAPIQGSEKVVGYFVRQKRECQLCGAVQLRTERTTFDN
jgi:hypothetical protein